MTVFKYIKTIFRVSTHQVCPSLRIRSSGEKDEIRNCTQLSLGKNIVSSDVDLLVQSLLQLLDLHVVDLNPRFHKEVSLVRGQQGGASDIFIINYFRNLAHNSVVSSSVLVRSWPLAVTLCLLVNGGNLWTVLDLQDKLVHLSQFNCAHV